MTKVTKVVIPVAGLGTRFLPATKALPKEMLPVVDKPVIQYVVEEAVSAGIERVLFITGRNKEALENHFDRTVEVEQRLASTGETSRLELVKEPAELAEIHYVRQGNPDGLGHAVSKAETFCDGKPFVLMLGDDLILDEGFLLRAMIELAENESATVIALSEVEDAEIPRYGIADVQFTEGKIQAEITNIIEKPSITSAPSNFAVIGRYVLQPSVFDALREATSGVNGEFQLTDALEIMVKNKAKYGPVIGFKFSGKRYDTGDKLSYLKAVVEVAATRADLKEEFEDWLRLFISKISPCPPHNTDTSQSYEHR